MQPSLIQAHRFPEAKAEFHSTEWHFTRSEGGYFSASGQSFAERWLLDAEIRHVNALHFYQ